MTILARDNRVDDTAVAPRDEARFDRLSWAILGLAALILALGLALLFYRASLPDGGQLIYLDGDGGGRGLVLDNGDILLAIEGVPAVDILAGAYSLASLRPATWAAGQTVHYTVWRDGRELTLPVLLRLRPAISSAAVVFSPLPLSMLLIGVWVFLGRPRNHGARLLMLFGVCNFAASLSTIVTDGWSAPRVADLFYRGAYWPTLLANHMFELTVPLLLHFFLTFPSPRPPLARRPRLTLVTIYGAMPAALLCLLGYYLAGGHPLALWPTFISTGAVIVTLMVLGIAISLGHALVTTRDPVERLQVRWLAWGAGVMVLQFVLLFCAFVAGELGLAGQGALDLLFQIGSVTMFALPLSLAIAVLRYRLFDIDIVINRTLVYGTLTAMLALLYAGSVVLFQGVVWGFGGPVDRQSTLAAVASTLVIALLSHPLRRRIQRFIDRRFYREKVDFRQAFTAFATEIRTILSLPELVRALVTRTADLLHITHAAVFLREADGVFRLAESRDLPPAAGRVLPLNRDLLEQLAAESCLARPQDALFPLLVPLLGPRTGGGAIDGSPAPVLVGVLALGPRRVGPRYSREDMALLMSLAGQAGTAIQVARLIDEQRAEAERRAEIERRLEAYRNSPLGRAETTAQELLTRPTAALARLHNLAQSAGSNSDAASLLSQLPKALENLGALPFARLAEGYYDLFRSHLSPELLPVGLRMLTAELERLAFAGESRTPSDERPTQLEHHETFAVENAAHALIVYRLCQEALNAGSLAQITELFPPTRGKGTFTAPLFVDQQTREPGERLPEEPTLRSCATVADPHARFLADLAHCLADLQLVSDALHAADLVDTPQDRLAYLAAAVERLSRVDRMARLELGAVDRLIVQRIAELWLAIVTGAISDLQTRARITCRLLTRHIRRGHEIALTISLRNEGQGTALGLLVKLAPAAEYVPLSEGAAVERLGPGDETQVELRLQPRLAAGADQFRARFVIRYADPRGTDQSEHFADLVVLLADTGTFQEVPNPYVVGTPLKGGSPLFVGREDLVRSIQTLLSEGHRNNLVLIGQRRTGKTSLLKQLPERLGEAFLPVYLDGQALALDPGLPNFFLSLATEIAFALEDRGFALAPPEPEEFSASPARTFERQFLPQVRELIGSRHLLLLLDEFEELESAVRRGSLDVAVFGFLRHLIQHGEDLSVIFCGTHRLEELTSDYWGALFNIALYRHIGFLEHAEAMRLVQEPVAPYQMRYDDLALDKIWRVTSGHPYFLQLLCHSLVNRHNRVRRSYISIADVNAALDDILAAGEAHFVYLWAESTALERLALTALSRMIGLGGQATPAQVADFLGERGVAVERRSVAATLHRLALRDILAATGDTSGPLPDAAYRWKLGLLGLWVEKYRLLSRVVDEAKR